MCGGRSAVWLMGSGGVYPYRFIAAYLNGGEHYPCISFCFLIRCIIDSMTFISSLVACVKSNAPCLL